MKATVVLQAFGDAETPPNIGYQLANIIEARGSNDPERINSTMDLVCKTYNATGGHVTPKDIVIFLRNAGPAAHTLSDDGLLSMITLIWQNKKDRGE